MRTKAKALLPLIIIAVLVLLSAQVRRSVSDSLQLCATVLLPALFPFFIISGILYDFGLDTLMPPAFCCFCIGAVCGYPLGTRAVCAYYNDGKITHTQAEHLLLCTALASPAFLISAVGDKLLGQHALGYKLFLAQLCAALLIFFLFVPDKMKKSNAAASAKVSESFLKNTRIATDQILYVCALTVFFGIFCDFLKWLPIDENLRLLGVGGIEILHGIALFEKQPMLLLCALLGWSGFCVFTQCASFVRQSGLNLRYLWLGKIAMAILLPLLFFLFSEI